MVGAKCREPGAIVVAKGAILTFELSRLGHTKWAYAKQRCVVQVGLNERLG